MPDTNCARCGAAFPPPPPHGGAAGYATVRATNERICYACCADDDRASLAAGKDPGLYLVSTADPGYFGGKRWEVTNWPGSLRMPARDVSTWKGRGFGGAYPCASARFTSPDGAEWSIQVRGNMDCGRSRRLKRQPRK